MVIFYDATGLEAVSCTYPIKVCPHKKVLSRTTTPSMGYWATTKLGAPRTIYEPL